MTNEELNTALYKKVFAEQEQYREWLLSRPPNEILNHCLQTACTLSTFRSGSGTAILPRRQISMPILITVPKSLRHRRWKQGLLCLKAVISGADGRMAKSKEPLNKSG